MKKVFLFLCLMLVVRPAMAACTPGVSSTADANGNGLVCVGGNYMAQVFGVPVGIGTAAPASGFSLSVDGFAILTSGPLWAISDRRMKKDIEPYDVDALEVVNQLRPVTYLWKNPKSEPMKERQIGFIAQDVAALVPELANVPADEKEMISLQYSGFIPVLTRAVQQLSAEVEETRKRLTALEAENRTLRSAAAVAGN